MQNSTSDNKAAADPSPPNRPLDLSESDFLAAEATTARRKIGDKVERLREDLKDLADVPAWARKYPWSTLGVAAALGFLAGSLVCGRKSKDNSAADLLAEALAAKAAAANVSPAPTIFSGLINEIVRGLTAALEGLIAGAFSSRMQPDNPADSSAQQAAADPPAGSPSENDAA